MNQFLLQGLNFFLQSLNFLLQILLLLIVFLILVVILDVYVPSATVGVLLPLGMFNDGETDVSVGQGLCIGDQQLCMVILWLLVCL